MSGMILSGAQGVANAACNGTQYLVGSALQAGVYLGKSTVQKTGSVLKGIAKWSTGVSNFQEAKKQLVTSQKSTKEIINGNWGIKKENIPLSKRMMKASEEVFCGTCKLSLTGTIAVGAASQLAQYIGLSTSEEITNFEYAASQMVTGTVNLASATLQLGKWGVSQTGELIVNNPKIVGLTAIVSGAIYMGYQGYKDIATTENEETIQQNGHTITVIRPLTNLEWGYSLGQGVLKIGVAVGMLGMAKVVI